MRAVDIAALIRHTAGAILCLVMHFACGKSFSVQTYQDERLLREGFNVTGVSPQEGLDMSCYDTPAQAVCIREGMPLYETPTSFMHFRPLALLGHFELVSLAFSLFHIMPQLEEQCTALVLMAPVVFAPYTIGRASITEEIFFLVGSLASTMVFFHFKVSQHDKEGHTLDPSSKVCLRYIEYSITRSQAWNCGNAGLCFCVSVCLCKTAKNM